MIYRKVGKISEKISVIGIGCWNFGGDWDSMDDKKSSRIIHAAIEKGINFFDVAPVYGFGHSEMVLGAALKEGSHRNKVLIASKGGLLWNEKHETRNNLSKASLLKEIDATLTRLQTDHVDIYQMHWPDPNVPLEETAEALQEMKRAGKIRYVGLSNFSQTDVEKMMEYTDVHCQQSLYNMLERNTDSYHSIPLEYKTEKEVLPNVRKFGQAFLPYSPLFQGLLAGKFHSGTNFSESDIRNANPKLAGPAFQQYFNGAEQIKRIAEEYGKPMNEVALNWLRQKGEVTSIIGGASTVEQLEQNIQCTTWDIDDEMMEKINKVLEPFENM
ncbi:aldo/keto reductase [Lacrimispora sp.]|uniref:aldo/keto reductase n=1 Tax=Lacrimispora sp. TaxID=2719234 RepID=UPI00345F80D2